MEDEFAALDAALESIAEQYEAPVEVEDDEPDLMDELDAMMNDAPPPVPDFDKYSNGPDLSMHLDVDQAARAAHHAAGNDFATFRAVNIDAAVQEYDQYMDGAPPPVPVRDFEPYVEEYADEEEYAAPEAPWGEQTLRYSQTAAAAAVPASAATMRAARQHASAAPSPQEGMAALQPVHVEFDLGSPPNEEQHAFRLPTIDYDAKVISLTVSCMDGRKETFDANESWLVEDVLRMMGSKLTLWQISFFALSETDVNADAPDRWLDRDATLQQEGVTNGSQLVFKIKFFKYPKKLRDPAAVHFFYAQTRVQVVRGTLETDEALAVQLAALQFAVRAGGDFRPQDLRPGVLGRELSDYLPAAHVQAMLDRGLTLEHVEKRIVVAYEEVKDLSVADATFAYLKAVKDLPLYGSTIFNVTLNGEPRVVGIAEDGMLLSQETAQKLQFFTPRGEAKRLPKYEFTPYEDITKVHLDPATGTVTVVVLSDTNAGTYSMLMAPAAALSLVELFCGYRRMLEAYTPLPKAFEFPFRPKIPHPALYAKPVKRKKLAFRNSRAEVFLEKYLGICKERKLAWHEPLVARVEKCIDGGHNVDELSFAGRRWGREPVMAVLDALVAAKSYLYSEGEDFLENMLLQKLDLSTCRVLEKGFPGELSRAFEELARHPYELRGVSFRNCGLSDKTIGEIRPAVLKLKKLEKGDFSKNMLKGDGVKAAVHMMRDANASFKEIKLNYTTVTDKPVLAMLAAMLDKNSMLTRLELANCSINDVGVALLMRGLVNHPRIKALNLSGNRLGSSKASSDLFIWALRTRSMEELRMARTEMPTKSSKAVAKLLSDEAPTIKAVDIGGNSYGTKGMTIVLEGLAQNSVLEEVLLDGLDVTDKNVEHLIRFVHRAQKVLRHLSVYGTPIGKSGKLPNLLRELAQCIKLKTLNLGRLPIHGRNTVPTLGDFLSQTRSLETLIMSGCAFDKDGWSGFCRCLPKARSLKRLELDQINISKCSLGELRDALQQSPHVREVSLKGCEMGPETLVGFLNVFQAGSNSGLNHLDARSNPALVNVRKHKKYGDAVAEKLRIVFLELLVDEQKK